MSLLAFLWLVGCIAACVIAFAVPNEIWQALAHRIRNPRPSAMELYYKNNPPTLWPFPTESPSRRPTFPVDEPGTEYPDFTLTPPDDEIEAW